MSDQRRRRRVEALQLRLHESGELRICAARWIGLAWTMAGLVGLGVSVVLLVAARRDGEDSAGIWTGGVVIMLLGAGFLGTGLRLLMDRRRLVLDADGLAMKGCRIPWGDVQGVGKTRVRGGDHTDYRYVVLEVPERYALARWNRRARPGEDRPMPAYMPTDEVALPIMLAVPAPVLAELIEAERRLH